MQCVCHCSGTIVLETGNVNNRPVRRILASLCTEDRLARAAEALKSLPGQETLLVASTRVAAGDFVRRCCDSMGGVFGAHRFTLPQLAAEIATPGLAEAGVALLDGVALEALAARAVDACRRGVGESGAGSGRSQTRPDSSALWRRR